MCTTSTEHKRNIAIAFAETPDRVFYAGCRAKTLEYLHTDPHGYVITASPLGKSLVGFRSLRLSESWHREDFTGDDIPRGYRPALHGETEQPGDEEFIRGRWCLVTGTCSGLGGGHNKVRTTRPLPSAQPYTRHTLPSVPFGVKKRGSHAVHTVVEANAYGVRIAEGGTIVRRTYQELFAHYERLDGGVCGVDL